jgi:low molecular weight protein-tyrosine phosphatase
MKKKKVLFVCLGNICRSPSAEAVMKKFVKNQGLENLIEVDSAGTINYHEGEPADKRMQKHAEKRGYILDHFARGFKSEIDFDSSDYIVTMDNNNYYDVTRLDRKNQYTDKLFKLSEFAVNIKFEEVPDPYYGSAEGFETVLDILEDACNGLLEKIKNDIKYNHQK